MVVLGLRRTKHSPELQARIAALAAERPEALAAEIAATEAESRTARADCARIAEAAAAELNDAEAESLLHEARAQERAARRAEARLPELRERLAEAQWKDRSAAFEKHRILIATAARKAIDAVTYAAGVNAASTAARAAASEELGTTLSQFPAIFYGGILFPDLVAMWIKQAERQLQQLDQAKLPRPRTLGTARSEVPQSAPAVAPMPVPAQAGAQPQPSPAPPAPPPRVRRQQRRDPPPGEGERQIHLLRVGEIELADGSRAVQGDYVNLPVDRALVAVQGGVANYVDHPAVAPAPAPTAEEKAA
jgi:hypothetical protein